PKCLPRASAPMHPIWPPNPSWRFPAALLATVQPEALGPIEGPEEVRAVVAEPVLGNIVALAGERVRPDPVRRPEASQRVPVQRQPIARVDGLDGVALIDPLEAGEPPSGRGAAQP